MLIITTIIIIIIILIILNICILTVYILQYRYCFYYYNNTNVCSYGFISIISCTNSIWKITIPHRFSLFLTRDLIYCIKLGVSSILVLGIWHDLWVTVISFSVTVGHLLGKSESVVCENSVQLTLFSVNLLFYQKYVDFLSLNFCFRNFFFVVFNK